MGMKNALLIGFILVAYCIADGKPLTEAEVRAVTTPIARRVGLDPDLLVAIAKVESDFNPKAVGRSHGEVGLFQLHPKFFPLASFDPKANAIRAAEYLAWIKKNCKNCGSFWYYKYNTGPNVTIADPEKLKYVQKVLTELRRIKGIPELRPRQWVVNLD